MTDTNPHDDIERLSLHLRDCVQKADSNWAYVNIDVLLDAAEYLERFAQPEPEGPTDEEILAAQDQAVASFPPIHPEAEPLSAVEYARELEIRKARASLARWGK